MSAVTINGEVLAGNDSRMHGRSFNTFLNTTLLKLIEIFFIESLPEEPDVKNDLHAENQCEGEINKLYLRTYNEKF